MPVLLVYRCNEPGCDNSHELVIEIFMPTMLARSISPPDDWRVDLDGTVFCPKHNKFLEIDREWKESLENFEKACEDDLQKNPPSGGFIPPEKQHTKLF